MALPPLDWLEERHYDRQFLNSDDPCRSLKSATQQAITMARLKMNNMLIDPYDLSGTAGWSTHASDLSGRILNIAAMISLGEKLGCDMTMEKKAAGSLFIPGAAK